jgi:hypothetical protein
MTHGKWNRGPRYAPSPWEIALTHIDERGRIPWTQLDSMD